MPPTLPLAWSLAALGLGGLIVVAGVLLRQLFLLRRQVARVRQQQEETGRNLAETRLRMESILALNRDLAQVQEEQSLVQAVLAVVKQLTGGVGCTYVPLDLWGQPQPAFTFGDLPDPVLRGWAEHLLSERVRSRCAHCQRLHPELAQECPLHLGSVTATMSIYCFPLALGERRLGMINLYLAPGQPLEDSTRQFLESILDQMALAIEALRLRTSEINTLREFHRLRSPEADLSVELRNLLDGVAKSLCLDGLQIRLRPMSDERFSNLSVQTQGFESIHIGQMDEDSRAAFELASPQGGQDPSELVWQALPLQLPEGQVLGTLLAVRKAQESIPSRYVEILQTTAAQAALMIEYERSKLALEYRVVIQERTRLAREIHDGLAQTLAFLKMQAAQMQTALAQGDQARLVRLVQENRAALSEAYTDTRQAIDHLRVDPEIGLAAWLENTSSEFEKSTGVHVELTLPEEEVDLLPEVQAQLVRIVQEALNNVRKHARASGVTLALRHWESDLILEVRDDGVGFDPEDVPAVAQYGLRGMRERAELIGAEFQITSQLQQGTAVRLFLPDQFQEIGE